MRHAKGLQERVPSSAKKTQRPLPLLLFPSFFYAFKAQAPLAKKLFKALKKKNVFVISTKVLIMFLRNFSQISQNFAKNEIKIWANFSHEFDEILRNSKSKFGRNFLQFCETRKKIQATFLQFCLKVFKEVIFWVFNFKMLYKFLFVWDTLLIKSKQILTTFYLGQRKFCFPDFLKAAK